MSQSNLGQSWDTSVGGFERVRLWGGFGAGF